MDGTFPLIPQYGTFVIRRKGHLPLAFKLIPPEHSLITMSPLCGVIKGNFKVILVKLAMGKNPDLCYSETWTLQLNSLKVNITIEGTSELPTLKVGNFSNIEIPKTNVLTYRTHFVSIKNPTRLVIKYTVPEAFNNLWSGKNEGELWPGQEVEHPFIFFPTELKDYQIAIRISFKTKNHLYDKSSSSTLVLYFRGTGVKEFLKSYPEHIDVGNVLVTSPQSTTFALQNEGDCETYVGLTSDTKYSNWSSEEVSFEPERLILQPREQKIVTVTVKPFSLGIRCIEIFYILFRSSRLDEPVKEVKVKLASLSCYSDFPRFQIRDLRAHNGVKGLPKGHLWSFFHIDDLNHLFKNLENGQRKELIIGKIPQYGKGVRKVIIELLLENVSDVPGQLSFSFIKTCECKPVKVSHSTTFTKWVNDCPHEKEIIVTPQVQVIQSRQLATVRFEVTFNVHDKNHSFRRKFSIQGLNNPQVQSDLELFFTPVYKDYIGKPLDIFSLSLHKTINLNFYTVFIGDLFPPTQILWLYNRRRESVSYSIEFKFVTEDGIFNCHNPTGSIKVNSMSPVFITFKPWQVKLYEALVVIKVGNRKWVSNFYAWGSNKDILKQWSLPMSGPSISLFPPPSLGPLFLSIDTIQLPPLRLHSTVKRIVFLTNKTPYTYFFHWRKCHIDDILRVTAVPKEGFIQKGEQLMIQIIIQSLCDPAIITSNFIFSYINYDTFVSSKLKGKIMKEVSDIFDQCFTYDGTKYSFPTCQGLLECPEEDVSSQSICLGINVRTYDDTQIDIKKPKIKKQFLDAPRPSFSVPFNLPKPKITLEEAGIAKHILTDIIWEMNSSLRFLKGLTADLPKLHYYQVASMKRTEKVLVKPSRYMVGNILNGIILSILGKQFNYNIDENNSHYFISPRCAQTNESRLNNPYYQGELSMQKE